MLYKLWLGVFMGLITGVIGKIINFTIDSMFSKSQILLTGHNMLFMPILGGVLLGLYRKYSNPNNPSEFNVAVVREELLCIQSYIMKPIYLLANIIVLGITLISGWSVGKQGPTVYLGAALGSFFAYRKERDNEEIKILIAGGVAGILASVFMAPLFAIAFVIEVILHKKAIKDWSPIIIASLSATLVAGGANWNMSFGYWTIYKDILDKVSTKVVFEPLVCIYMSLIMGFLSALYTISLRIMKKYCIKINKPIIVAVFAGIFISAVGYIYPQIFNSNTCIIPYIISENLEFNLLIGLFIAKFIVTVISLSAGGVGGVFVPGLYIGAAVGKVFGIIMILLNITHMPAEIYAIMGMFAFFAGFSSSPLSATFLAIEITSEPRLLIPMLFISLTSGAVYRLFCDYSMYGYSLSVDDSLSINL